MADAEKGHLEAQTRTGAGDGGDQEPPDVLDVAGLPDALSLDVLGAAAELVAKERRGRGRPAGSGNRRNDDMMRYLQNLGHRDPAVTLSMIQTADTKDLARTLCADPIDVLKVQEKAASRLMEYFYAKKPQQLELPRGDRVPVMVIGGDVNVTVGAQGGFETAGVLPEEFQQLIDGEAVRDRKP